MKIILLQMKNKMNLLKNLVKKSIRLLVEILRIVMVRLYLVEIMIKTIISLMPHQELKV